MYYVETELHFDSAHFLKGYKGKCQNIHGHRWRVIVQVKGERLTEEGVERSMLIDFNRLKKELGCLCEKMDHCLLYEKGSLEDSSQRALQQEGFQLIEITFRPTAEELAHYFFEKLKEKGVNVSMVKIYETPETCAIYEE